MAIRTFALALALALCLAIPTALRADDPGTIPVVPIPETVPADLVTWSGTWSYASFDEMTSGPCPPMRRIAGQLALSGNDAEVAVRILSGTVCDPAEMCALSGDVEDGAILVSTSGTVDDEGGSVTTAMRILFTSDTTAKAKVSSRYVHPEGMSCNWTYMMDLSLLAR